MDDRDARREEPAGRVGVVADEGGIGRRVPDEVEAPEVGGDPAQREHRVQLVVTTQEKGATGSGQYCHGAAVPSRATSSL
ncbi:hypothetical protein GCM10010357_47600 [Streptomyces luteireticuli]|uniref:Uncharacterized protein n=1 Tax=Streptomyces luteireticuli TaxID=173858 RepID=A0ABP3IRS9_9ACTN